MESGVKLAPETVKGVVRWVEGTLFHGGVGADWLGDVVVRVEVDLGGVGSVRGVMLTRLHPVKLVLPTPGGWTVQVQTFRYRSAAGDERYLCYCACCGDQMLAELCDLKDGVERGCRKCGMAVSAVGREGPCIQWHTFGSCLRCPAADAPPMAAAPVGNAGPQSGPAPHAGPANSSQGPVPGSCPSPSPLGGCGCGRCLDKDRSSH